MAAGYFFASMFLTDIYYQSSEQKLLMILYSSKIWYCINKNGSTIAQEIMQKHQPRSFCGKFSFDPNFLIIIARKKKKKRTEKKARKEKKRKKKNTRMNFNESFGLVKNNKIIISKISF